MIELSQNTYEVRIFASGPIEAAKQILRRETMREGLCVTIAPTTYIYTGGEETGYVVGLVQYPRFPLAQSAIWERACKVARLLLKETFQHSIMIMSPDETLWLSSRENGA